MTFDRFENYVKCMGGAAVCAHLLINTLFLNLILGRPELSENPFPVALPISIAAGLYGWWIVYKSPLPPKYRTVTTECPCCHQTVTKKVLVDSLDKTESAR